MTKITVPKHILNDEESYDIVLSVFFRDLSLLKGLNHELADSIEKTKK